MKEKRMFGKLGTTLALAGATVLLTTSLAVAAEGLVTKMDEKGAMVLVGEKEHMVSMIPGAKVGDKVNCTAPDGRTGTGGTTGMTGGTAGSSTGTSGGTTGGTAGGTTGTPGGMTGGTAGTATTTIQMMCTKM
jgi:hypothetical protein